MTTLPRSRALTRADLDAVPDDGHRYELLDGALIVTPAPTSRHQNAVVRLIVLLDGLRPASMQVLTAPFDVALADDTVLQPDVLVARRSDVGERDVPVAPLLVIEVLSPSTRRIDLTLKKDRYAEAGCPSYWVVDPEAGSVTVWRLDADGYVQTTHGSGEDPITVTEPFPIQLRPAAFFA